MYGLLEGTLLIRCIVAGFVVEHAIRVALAYCDHGQAQAQTGGNHNEENH